MIKIMKLNEVLLEVIWIFRFIVEMEFQGADPTTPSFLHIYARNKGDTKCMFRYDLEEGSMPLDFLNLY